MVLAMFCVGVSVFAQLYAPQSVLPSLSRAFGVGASASALMVSSGTLGLALFALPWTYAADRWGKTGAIRTALLLATGLGLLLPWTGGFGLMLGLRLVQGAALAGAAGLAVALITEEVSAAGAGSAAGLYVAGTTLGGLAGRLLSGPLTQWTGDWRLGLTAVSGVGAVAAAGFLLLVPPARGFVPVPASGAAAETVRRVLEHLRSPRMDALFFYAFATMGCFVTVFNYLSYALEGPPHRLSPAAVALVFLVYLFGTLSSSGAGRLARRVGRWPLLVAAPATMLVGLGLTLSRQLPWVLAGLVLITLGFFAGHAVASAWTGVRAARGRAQATALYNLFYYLGSAVVGWAGGLFYQAGGWPMTAGFCAVVLVVGAVVTGVGLPRREA